MRKTVSIRPLRRSISCSAGVVCVVLGSIFIGVLNVASALARDAGSRIQLKVPHIRQETNLCVPTSAAMVLRYFGEQRSPREIKVLSRGQQYDPRVKFSDFTETFFRDLIRGMTSLGYQWTQHRYSYDDSGFDSGLRDIIDEVKNDKPVLVDVAYSTGHTFVIAGFDQDSQKLFVVDPNFPSPGTRQLTFQQLKSVWNTPGTNSRFLVLTSRKIPAELSVDGVPVPGDAKVKAPREMPEKFSGFSGAWVGLFGGQLRHILIVENIMTDGADGRASIVYAVGDNPAANVHRQWLRYNAEISGKTLRVGSFATYELTTSGQLSAGFQVGNAPRATAMMTRIKLDDLTVPGAIVQWNGSSSP